MATAMPAAVPSPPPLAALLGLQRCLRLLHLLSDSTKLRHGRLGSFLNRTRRRLLLANQPTLLLQHCRTTVQRCLLRRQRLLALLDGGKEAAVSRAQLCVGARSGLCISLPRRQLVSLQLQLGHLREFRSDHGTHTSSSGAGCGRGRRAIAAVGFGFRGTQCKLARRELGLALRQVRGPALQRGRQLLQHPPLGLQRLLHAARCDGGRPTQRFGLCSCGLHLLPFGIQSRLGCRRGTLHGSSTGRKLRLACRG